MQYNRCPAVAPLSVLDDASKKRIGLDVSHIQKHQKVLKDNPEFIDRILAALQILDTEQEQRQNERAQDAEARLYDGFYDTHDANLLGVVRAAAPEELSSELAAFHDARLTDMLLGYKAKNYTAALTDEERKMWEEHRYHVFMDGGTSSRLARYMHRLAALAEATTSPDQRYILEELQLYAESILPVADSY
ncbi:hypothetical protein KDA14_01205, partial [Candidatus Saccharibacteria bacterium]|nr:hypothetical protein [Candidatus Saccharibacteria bacterium]